MNILLLITFIYVVLASDFQSEIKQAQTLLSSEGPNSKVLGEFSKLIKKIEQVDNNDGNLSQLYYKKSLIEINLSKEKDAIQDLKTTLLLDPLLTPAKTKLIDLLMDYSYFDDEIFTTNIDPNVSEKINKFKTLYKELQSGKCEVLDELIAISPMNASLYKFKITCAQKAQDENTTKDIINSLTKLIKLDSIDNLSNYYELSSYLLYTSVNFNKAYSTIKQCLRINNEDKNCGKLSKFFTKYSKLFEILETYSIEIGHIYLVGEGGENPTIGEINLSDIIDFKFVKDFLNDEPNKRLIQGLSNISNNYEYLIYSIKEFSKSTGIPLNKVKLYNDLHKLYCESFIQTAASDRKICQQIDDDNFFPKFVTQIDSLITKKKYEEADKLFKSFPPNTRQTELFKTKYAPIEEYRRQQQQRQQQQQQQRFYQQQQQRQQQQRQYQYRQQQQSNNQPPKNDYYKVLDVAKDADEKTIKKAYRTQTLKYHPDKYKGNDLTPQQIEAKMQEINQAYEVLSDGDLRARYDRGDDPNDSRGQSQASTYRGGPMFNFGNGGSGASFKFNFGSGGGGFQFGGFGNGNGPKAKFQRTRKSG